MSRAAHGRRAAGAPLLVRSSDPVAEAARRVAQALAAADKRQGRARLAIAGGSSLAALASMRRALAPIWSRLALTWVDERCVAFAHADSNRGAAYRGGALDATDPPGRVLPLFLDGERPDEAVARVERGLAEDFGGALDVLLLGMGPDGHIASLFPGRPLAAPAGARAAFVPDSPKPPARRITLTPAALATASVSVLLAAGEAKRAALERLLAGDPDLPATGLCGVVVVSDLELGMRPS